MSETPTHDQIGGVMGVLRIGGADPGQATNMAAVTGIDVSLEALRTAVTEFEEALSRLELRLEPVLCGKPPSDPRAESHHGDSPVAIAITGQTDRILAGIEWLQQVTRRIDLS